MSTVKKLKHPYGYVANTIINDKMLSYNAKGIYLYILSKPEKWDFSHKRIAEDSTTSEYSVRKAVKELEGARLLKRLKLGSGRVIYEIKDPVQECVIQKTNTTSGSNSQKMNTQVADSQVAKTGGISKKEYKVRKSISNKDNISSYYGEFGNVKLTNEEYQKLIEGKIGKERADELIEDLSLYIASVGDKYKNHYAVILTWSKRKSFNSKFNKKLNNKSKNITTI